jgi:hypothetical protein
MAECWQAAAGGVSACSTIPPPLVYPDPFPQRNPNRQGSPQQVEQFHRQHRQQVIARQLHIDDQLGFFNPEGAPSPGLAATIKVDNDPILQQYDPPNCFSTKPREFS